MKNNYYTPYEKKPPNKKQFQALSTSCEEILRDHMKTDGILQFGILAMIKTVWNWQDNRTRSYLINGANLIKHNQLKK